MKRGFIILSLLTGFGVFSVFGQSSKLWTLKDCIEYARQNNIQLQQNRISLLESEVDVKSANAALFPSLSFSTSHNITNRPYQENSSTVSGTEIITSNHKTTYNGTYGLNAQWTLWNGHKTQNTLKQRKASKEIASLSVEETDNSLQEQIAQLFVQILYATESVKVNENTLSVSQQNYQRGQAMFDAGNISRVDLAQLESQVSSDSYQLVLAQNTLRDYKLQLKQLLQLDGSDVMELALPDIADEDVLTPLPQQEDVYQQALSSRPEIKRSQLNIENSKLDISIAKAGYYPTLSLSASIGSNTNSASSMGWASQMKYGWNNSIGLNLSIPIFDNRQNKSAVEKARLQLDSNQLELINQQRELYQTVETLWHNANNAQHEFIAAESNLQSSQTSYELTNEQFNLGMKNIIELLTEKNNYLNASQQRLQAKYTAVLAQTLLKFYAGDEINL